MEIVYERQGPSPLLEEEITARLVVQGGVLRAIYARSGEGSPSREADVLDLLAVLSPAAFVPVTWWVASRDALGMEPARGPVPLLGSRDSRAVFWHAPLVEEWWDQLFALSTPTRRHLAPLRVRDHFPVPCVTCGAAVSEQCRSRGMAPGLDDQDPRAGLAAWQGAATRSHEARSRLAEQVRARTRDATA